MSTERKPCMECGERPKMKGVHRCGWCWLARQPIGQQVVYAERRRARAESRPGFTEKPRVPKEAWPAGMRWCSGCQSFVPMRYVQGSRCKACNSKAAHASRIKAVYDLDPDEYERLLAWQGGVCYICGKSPKAKRLAVDHDHETGNVRGLLCAGDEWGCNVSLRLLLNDIDMARRALAYVERTPLERMRGGEASPAPHRPQGTLELIRAAGRPPAGRRS